MAQRPVYKMKLEEPYYECINVEFVYNGGFAVSQKQKNIIAIHKAYKEKDINANILEISTKSLQPIGISLSAFNLTKYVPSIKLSIPVENVYQGSKVFEVNGPFVDLYKVSPKAAKKDERLKQSGHLTAFSFEGQQFPLIPKTAFYDWIYINALMENKELVDEIVKYEAFTDVEFNPQKSLNCQARAAAIFVSLYRCGKLCILKNFDEFLNIYE